MASFNIFPAIDLRAGQVVRLRQGDPQRQTAYHADPAKVARQWRDAGARWLHVVNLDGALGKDSAPNRRTLRAVLAVCEGEVGVQLGGGIRDIDAIEYSLALGVARVVIGTAALEEPGFAAAALRRFGAARIAFALDVWDGEVMQHGWQQGSGVPLFDHVSALKEIGARMLIYTDIRKDGMESGVDWQTAARITRQADVGVIASGGVRDLDDIRHGRAAGLSGVIIGRALYERRFTLQEALRC